MKSLIIVMLMLSIYCQSESKNAHGNKDIKSSIGVKDFSWTDPHRMDEYYGGRRIINARIWYPAVQLGARSTKPSYYYKINQVFPYLDGWSEEDLDLVNSVETNGYSDYDWDEVLSKYPLIVFSPSLGGNLSHYTFYAEHLAENGYIVMGVNHLYESEYVMGSNGSTYVSNLRFHDSLKRLQIPDQISAENYRKVKGKRQKVLGQDLIFAINKILEEPFFKQRIDADLIGAFGHSIGGSAAIYASILDHRIKVVIDLDGTPPSIALNNGLDVLFLFIEDLTDYQNHQGYAKLHNRRNNFCEINKKDSWRILVRGVNHDSFLDINYYLERNRKLKSENLKFLTLVSVYIEDFLDHHLLSSPLIIQETDSDTLEIIHFKK